MPFARHARSVAALCALLPLACARTLTPPEASAAAVASEVSVGAVVQLDASASRDTNTPPLPVFYRWAFTALPPGSAARLNDATIVNPSFVADAPGEYVAALVVTSGQLSSVASTVTVTAGPCGANRPEVSGVAAAPATPRLGDAVLLTATADDADDAAGCDLAQALHYRWSIATLPAGSRAALNLPEARTPSFTADRAGDYLLRLVVTDDTGRASAPFEQLLTVSTCGGAAPLVQAPGADPAAPNIGQLVQLSAEAVDADNADECAAGQTLSYAWSFVSLPSGSRAALNDPAVLSPSFVPDLPGGYVLRVRVSDGTGLSTLSPPLLVEASSCGAAAPSVASIAAAPALPNSGQVVQLTAEISDADSAAGCDLPQTVDYAWRIVALPAGSGAELNNARATNPSFVADLPGTYVAALTATDATGRASPRSLFTVEVATCGSAAPTAEVEAPASAGIGSLVHLAATVADSDDDAPCSAGQTRSFAWSFVSRPAGSAALLNDVAVARPSFVPDAAGEYVLRLVVTDSTGRSSVAAHGTVVVTACGGARPVARPETSSENPNVGQVVLLTAGATDVDNSAGCSRGQTFSYAWAIDSLPAGSAAALNGATAVTPSFVPDVPGAYVVRLVATDSTGRPSDPARLTITATACGSALPQVAVTASTDAAGVGAPVRFVAAATDADNADGCGAGQTFSYEWNIETLPTGSRATLNSSTAATPSLTPDLPGNYVLRVVATDSTGRASLPHTFELAVSACGGAAPEAAATASLTAPAIGQAVLLSGTATDADNTGACAAGQTFTYRWAFEALPAGSVAGLNAPTAATPSFVPDVPGDYVLRLVAADSTGRSSAPAFVTLTADACGGNAPGATVTATPANAGTGMVVRLVPTAVDADNAATCQELPSPTPVQSLSYAWTLLSSPAGSASALVSDAREPSFTADRAGSYTVRLVVTDSTGRRSADVDTVVTVDPCGGNAPQVLSATASTAAPNAGTPVLLGGTFGDADNDAGCQAILGERQTHAYAWRIVQAPAGSRTALDHATTLSATLVPDVAGEYQVELEVADSTGRRGAATVTLTASACGTAAPALAATLDAASTARVGGVVLLRSNGTDADNAAACAASQTLTYQWWLQEVPAGSAADFVNPFARDASFSPDLGGTYVAAVQAIDSTGRASAVSSVSVTVSACGGNRPIARITGPTTGLVDASVQLDALGTNASSDADNAAACGLSQALSFRWEVFSAPNQSQTGLTPSSTVSNPSLLLDRAGTYVVRLWVTDSTGRESEPATHTITN